MLKNNDLLTYEKVIIINRYLLDTNETSNPLLKGLITEAINCT